MPKIRLRYFSGTGNTLRLAEIFRDKFEEAGWSIDLKAIRPDLIESSSADRLGLFFPTYAYGAPRLVRAYIKTLPLPPGAAVQAFVLTSMGGVNGQGWAISEGIQLLESRGYQVSFGEAIQMPNNWAPGSYVPSQAEAAAIFERGCELASQAARRILTGEHYRRPFHYPPLGYLAHAAFHRLGVQRGWRYFKLKANCNGCGACARACPVQAIGMLAQKPIWSAACEQCLRCYNLCPQRAIGQLDWLGGAGRNRYLAPGFKP